MTQIFKLEVFEGHLIMLHDGQEILIDTGSPVTLSNLKQIVLMGDTYQCHNQMVGCTFDSIKEMLGRDIDVLLGMDVLRNYRLLVNCQVGLLKMSDESLTIKDATSVRLHPAIMNSGVAVEATVADSNVQLVVDTGAKISYISRTISEGLESIGEREDFHPHLGIFTTPIYMMPIEINEKQLSIEFGNLPQLYAMALSMAKNRWCDWVRSVCCKSGSFGLSKYGNAYRLEITNQDRTSII